MVMNGGWFIFAIPTLQISNFEESVKSHRAADFFEHQNRMIDFKVGSSKLTHPPPPRPTANRAMGRSLCHWPGRRDGSCSYPPVAQKFGCHKDMLTNSRDVDLQT